MSLTSKDKENLLKMVSDAKTIDDLKLVIQTMIVLEDFAEK